MNVSQFSFSLYFGVVVVFIVVVFGIFSSLFSLSIAFCAFRFRLFGNRNIAFVFDFDRIGVSLNVVLFLNLVFIMIIILSPSISFIDQGHRHFVNDLSTLILMTLFVVVGGVDDDDGVVSLLLSRTHKQTHLDAIFSI